MTWGIRLQLSFPRNPSTHTCCRAFGSGAFTTSFNDLAMPRLGCEHSTLRLWGERSNRLPIAAAITTGMDIKDIRQHKGVKYTKEHRCKHTSLFHAAFDSGGVRGASLYRTELWMLYGKDEILGGHPILYIMVKATNLKVKSMKAMWPSIFDTFYQLPRWKKQHFSTWVFCIFLHCWLVEH